MKRNDEIRVDTEDLHREKLHPLELLDILLTYTHTSSHFLKTYKVANQLNVLKNMETPLFQRNRETFRSKRGYQDHGSEEFQTKGAYQISFRIN